MGEKPSGAQGHSATGDEQQGLSWDHSPRVYSPLVNTLCNNDQLISMNLYAIIYSLFYG